jgi:hypothetical protein
MIVHKVPLKTIWYLIHHNAPYLWRALTVVHKVPPNTIWHLTNHITTVFAGSQWLFIKCLKDRRVPCKP